MFGDAKLTLNVVERCPPAGDTVTLVLRAWATGAAARPVAATRASERRMRRRRVMAPQRGRRARITPVPSAQVHGVGHDPRPVLAVRGEPRLDAVDARARGAVVE